MIYELMIIDLGQLTIAERAELEQFCEDKKNKSGIYKASPYFRWSIKNIFEVKNETLQ